MSKKPKYDSARIETFLAGAVLLAVIGLFVRFQLVQESPAPLQAAPSVPAAVAEPVPQ
jgi:hypothetical protein